MEIVERIKNLEHIRDWLHSHPSKVDPDVRPAAIDWVNGEITELKQNNHPAPTPNGRHEKTNCFVSILTHWLKRRQVHA